MNSAPDNLMLASFYQKTESELIRKSKSVLYHLSKPAGVRGASFKKYCRDWNSCLKYHELCANTVQRQHF